jgi:organic hydroperoxide reductase OsmC/OhrA
METKRAYKSFRYKSNLVWSGARRGKASVPGKSDIEVGSPPEFRGEPGMWSPEEMLVAALNTCLMLTFISLAGARKLEFVSYESSADGLLENVEGTFRITEVSVEPNLVLKSQADVETARGIMGEVEKHCFISNSITAKVKLNPQLRVG